VKGVKGPTYKRWVFLRVSERVVLKTRMRNM
jgi:hypothetical protein